MPSNKSNVTIPKTHIINKMNLLKNRKLKILVYSFYIILIDQVSKFWILNTLGFYQSKIIIPYFLNLTLVKNKGAAFSISAIQLLFLL